MGQPKVLFTVEDMRKFEEYSRYLNRLLAPYSTTPTATQSKLAELDLGCRGWRTALVEEVLRMART